MRKLLAALVAFGMTIGLAVAAEVTFVKFDAASKTLTVKEDGKDKEYKVGEKVKVSPKLKEGTKLDITVADGAVSKLKVVK